MHNVCGAGALHCRMPTGPCSCRSVAAASHTRGKAQHDVVCILVAPSNMVATFRLRHLEILDQVPFDLVNAFHERVDLRLSETRELTNTPGGTQYLSMEVRQSEGSLLVLHEA